MVVSEITLYNALKLKMEVDAQTIVEGIKTTVKEEFENKKDIPPTKQDKVDLIEKMNHDKQDILKWLYGFWITIILMILANLFFKH